MVNDTRAARRTLAVLLLALSFAVAACGSQAESASRTPVVQTVPEGQFTAEFPTAPVYKEETFTAAGQTLVLNSYMGETAGETVAVGYVDYPKGLTLSLSGAAEGSASSMNGTIQTRSETTFMGHPTLDVVLTTPEGQVYARYVLRERRLYTLIGVGADGKPASYDRLVETFVMH